MKITDLFARIPKGSTGTESGKSAHLIQPVQPVGLAGKLTLVPGQLLQGEVVGQDTSGLLLLKLAGEVISARTPMKLEPGQMFWFEVKEAGDSPLLDLASGKGAIQDLLKEIMATRPLLVKSQAQADGQPAPSANIKSAPGPQPTPSAQQQVEAPPQKAVPVDTRAANGAKSSGEAMPQPQAEQTPGRLLPVVGRDGTLPAESVRLIKALVSFVESTKTDVAFKEQPSGSTKFPPLIKTIATLVRDERVPPSLLKIEGFVQALGRGEKAAMKVDQPGAASSSENTFGAAGDKVIPSQTSQEGVSSSQGPGVSPSSGVALAPSTVRILNALVAISGIKPPSMEKTGPLQPAANPDQNLAEILNAIDREGRIPTNLRELGPIKMLINPTVVSRNTMPAAVEQAGAAKSTALSAETGGLSKAVFPLQFAAAQQGQDPLPAQLRLLASLMGLGPKEGRSPAWREIEEVLVRIPEAEMPAATRKFASFFEAHSRVNEELAGQPARGQGDFYIIPTVFAGQAGWGEWLWSKEGQGGASEGNKQENLVFFLEMSNLGALTIQILLKEKKLRGQIAMSDKKGSELVSALLPGLHVRLEALGYDTVDFSCICQPVNLMQELRDNLHSRAGAGPVSLLDVQA